MILVYVLLAIMTISAILACLIARQYYRLFRVVYASVSRLAVFLDTELRILSINEKGALLMNCGVKDLTGRFFLELFPEPQRTVAAQILKKKLEGDPLLSKIELDYYSESKSVCWSYFNFIRWRREIVFLSRDPFLKEHSLIERMQQINRNYQDFVLNTFNKFERLHDFVWHFVYEFQNFFQSKRIVIVEIPTGRLVYDTDESGAAFPKNFIDHLVGISAQGIGVIKNGGSDSFIDTQLAHMNVNYQMCRIVRPNWLFVAQKTHEFSKNFYMQQWDEFENHIFFQLTSLFEFELKEFKEYAHD